MFGVLGLVGAIVQATPAFGGEDPVAGPWYHEHITWEAARQAGWEVGTGIDAAGKPDPATAAAALAWHADYVDSYQYNPLWWAGGGPARFKAALLTHDELTKVHFDDLTSLAQIGIIWERYLAGTVAGLLWAADHGDVPAARHVVGVSLHASQDFYAHSNWVDDPLRRQHTWFDVAGAAPSPNLYTGSYELPDHLGVKPHGKPALDCAALKQFVPAWAMDVLCLAISPMSNSPLCQRWRECKQNPAAALETVAGVKVPAGWWLVDPGIALDSTWLSKIGVQQRTTEAGVTGIQLFEAASGLAVRHSRQWLDGLGAMLGQLGHGQFWHRVKTEPRSNLRTYPGPAELTAYLSGYGPDLDQFEHAEVQAYTFLSAGQYPPDPTAGPDGWYLRLNLRTSGEVDAGTDADIWAEVAGAPFLLDRMNGREPGGGLDENRLLEYDDFERGSDTAYVIGPFDAIPGELLLRNSAATLADIVEGARHDLVTLAAEFLKAVGDFLLDLTAGHADVVAGAKQVWSWQELTEIAGGQRTNGFLLDCDGGTEEGHFQVLGYLDAVVQDEGMRVDVHYNELRCVRESRWDRGSDSDESFVLLLVNSPAANQTATAIAGVYNGVDTGDSIAMDQILSVDVPRYGMVIAPVEVLESDDEGAGRRDELLASFASKYAADTANARSKFLDAVGRAVAADWRPHSISVFAFRRGPVVETAHLATHTAIGRWIRGGESHRITLTPAGAQRVRVPYLGTSNASLPAVLTMLLAGMGDDASPIGAIHAATINSSSVGATTCIAVTAAAVLL